jgi:single-stranded-DNA-specific exonuclease
LGPEGLRVAQDTGCSLIVTVDCGILAHHAVADAKARGLDIIITDHHTPDEDLPAALAVLNPARRDSRYSNPGLCGAGVAFKLCQGLAEAWEVDQEELYPYLDLVGLATIADLVPLKGENRSLARYGLRALERTRNLGLRALLAEAGISASGVSAGNVGFGLAPRLNAMGRLGEPMDGLRLLLTDKEEEARRLARAAQEMNRERQNADKATLSEALEQLAGRFDAEKDFGVVLESEHWHPGVVGIAASRLVERIHRPSILIALDGDRGRGSARSIPGFDVLEGIRACGSLLGRFGGHKQAAGIEIRRERIPQFREAFNQASRAALEGRDLRPVLAVDMEIHLEEISREFHRFLQYLEPHGIGNPTPSFLTRGATLPFRPRIVGGDHLKFRMRQGKGELDAIGFHLSPRVTPRSLGKGPADVVFQLHENEFRGVRRLEARVRDLRPEDGSGVQTPGDP